MKVISHRHQKLYTPIMIWNWQEIVGIVGAIIWMVSVNFCMMPDTPRKEKRISGYLAAVGFIGFIFGLVFFCAQQNTQSEAQARSGERTEIKAQLTTMNTLVVAEEEYYHGHGRFAFDPSTLWLSSTDPQVRKRLRPLAVDGNSRHYLILPVSPLSLKGLLSMKEETIRLDTGHYSRRFVQDNDYTVYLHVRGQSFLAQRLCSAHYYCVDHRWAGIPAPTS